ncbi:hypothetical protein NFI96_026221 [Prochilodus magdalenae]|nr:hypothetical protein NFI96_026221 [Prochilodus magdalenae]
MCFWTEKYKQAKRANPDTKDKDLPKLKRCTGVNRAKCFCALPLVMTTVLKRIIQRAPKVPLLTPTQVQACLKFTSDHLIDTEKAWKKVLWSDETKI